MVAVGLGVFEVRRHGRLSQQTRTLQQQGVLLAEEVRQLQHERDYAKSQLESLLAENELLKTSQSWAELQKLRGAVTSLRTQARDLAQLKSPEEQDDTALSESAEKEFVGRMNLLIQGLEQRPEKNIPELQYLDSEAWARVAHTAKLDMDAGVRQGLSSLRYVAKENFAPIMARALKAYTQANEGRLPKDTLQLKSYFESPVDDATLVRYEMIGSGNVGDLQPGQMLVSEKGAVDNEYDYIFQIGLNRRIAWGVGQNAPGSISATLESGTD